MPFHTRTHCRSCETALGPVFVDLGVQPSANAYLNSSADIVREQCYPLLTRVCPSCFLVKVAGDVPADELFGDYAYFSSVSESWLDHARRYCEMARARFGLTAKNLIVELASNDGYLLKNFVAAGIPVLGIDPSYTVAAAAEKQGVPTLVEFFGPAVADRLAAEGRQADLIIGNNVLAHVPEPSAFVAGIAKLLKPGGTVNIEFPHLLKLIQNGEFDTIYHEHYSYLSLMTVELIFARHGLRIFDVEELPTHGGSLRIYARHANTCSESDVSVALRKVRDSEAAASLSDLATYQAFAQKTQEIRREFLTFVGQEKQKGKRICGYGAAAKGNTFLNFCGISSDDIALIADRSEHKQGKLAPGSHIPIVHPADLIAARPDYVIILPWNLRTEISHQLQEIRSWGGQFVTAIPKTTIF